MQHLPLLFLLLLSLLSTPAFSQFADDSGSCGEGRELAMRHVKHGRFQYITFGLRVGATNLAFEKYHGAFVQEKYGIKMMDGGCVVTPFSKCYTQRMDRLIEQKWGKDWMERTMEEAEKAYPESEMFKEEILEKIGSGHVFSISDIQIDASYAGGKEALIAYIRDGFGIALQGSGTIDLQVVVDELGKVSQVSVSGIPDREVAEGLRSLLRQSTWVPASHYGHAVKVRHYERIERN